MSTETLPPLIRQHRKPCHSVGPAAISPQRVEGELSKHTHKEDSQICQVKGYFAIRLRRVRFDWLKSKDDNPARLEKTIAGSLHLFGAQMALMLLKLIWKILSERVPH